MSTQPRLDDPETVVRYLSDKLSGAEREVFEERYLADPTVVKEMELDAKLKAGLISIRDSNELDRLTAVLKRSWAALPLAIAASLLVTAIAFLIFRHAAPGTVLAESIAALRGPLGSQLAVVTSHTLAPTRAGIDHEVIPLPKSPQAIRLLMFLDMDPPMRPVDVRLIAVADDASRRELTVLHQLRADERGIITLYLSSAAIGPGIYELAVARNGPLTETPESTFVLRVTPSEDPPSSQSP